MGTSVNKTDMWQKVRTIATGYVNIIDINNDDIKPIIRSNSSINYKPLIANVVDYTSSDSHATCVLKEEKLRTQAEVSNLKPPPSHISSKNLKKCNSMPSIKLKNNNKIKRNINLSLDDIACLSPNKVDRDIRLHANISDISDIIAGSLYQKNLPLVVDDSFNMLQHYTRESLFFSGIIATCCAAQGAIDLNISATYSKDNTYVYTEVLGQYVLGRWYKFNNLYAAFYIKAKYVTYLTRKVAAYIGALAVGNLRVLDSSNDGDWYKYYDYEEKIYDSTTVISIRKGDYVRESITADHHTLIRPEEALLASYPDAKSHYITKKDGSISIVSTTIKGNNETIKLISIMLHQLRRLKIETEAVISTFITYAITTKIFALRVLIDILVNVNDFNELKEQLKLEGRLSKQLQHYKREDLNYLFELNVLINRRDENIDWTKEIYNRTRGKQVIKIPKHIVYNEAKKIFSHALLSGKTPMKKDWYTYWRQRWATMPTGSFISQYENDKIEKKKFKNARMRNKTTVLSSIGERDLQYYINRIPEIYASASIKYEWGKVRALYGCDITSFLMADFSMGSAEECLPYYFPVGSQSSEDNVKLVMMKMNKGLPLCYDYDDFNSQHTITSMKTVIKAWIDVFSPFLDTDQIAAAYWTMSSIDHMYANIKELNNNKFIVEGGLFSGWRHTAFMNTVLNRIYLLWAGMEKYVMYGIHNGDDVFASISNIGDGLQLIENARQLGVRAQLTKMNIGTIAEFLRVDGMAKDPSGAQYLTRACATAVHARVESEAAISIISGLDASKDRMDSIRARGGKRDVVARLHLTVVKNWCHTFETSLSAAIAYHNTHPIQGGSNINAPIRDDGMRIATETIDVDDDVAKHAVALMDKGSQDYVNYLAEQMSVDISETQRDKIKRMNLSMLKGCKVCIKLVPETRKNVKNLRAVYKAHKDIDVTISISKMRMIGQFGLIVGSNAANNLINWLQTKTNIEELLSIVV